MKKSAVTLIFAICILYISSSQERPGEQLPPETHESFKLGVAGFSFVRFDLDQALETMKKADVKYLFIKDLYLPFSSTEKEINDFHTKLESFG